MPSPKCGACGRPIGANDERLNRGYVPGVANLAKGNDYDWLCPSPTFIPPQTGTSWRTWWEHTYKPGMYACGIDVVPSGTPTITDTGNLPPGFKRADDGQVYPVVEGIPNIGDTYFRQNSDHVTVLKYTCKTLRWVVTGPAVDTSRMPEVVGGVRKVSRAVRERWGTA